jgi:hypothetical protein
VTTGATRCRVTPAEHATTRSSRLPETPVDAKPGTRRRASSGLPKSRGTATCVPDLAHCEPPAGKPGYSSRPDCGPSWPAARGSPADRTREAKKIFCCVTTRRRNLRVLVHLRHGLDSLTARPLGLRVLRPGLCRLTTLRLPPRCLPAADFPPALRLLAVTLVPAPRLVLAPAPLAQTDAHPRSSPSGISSRLSLNLAGAHGRPTPTGKPGENAPAFSSGA